MGSASKSGFNDHRTNESSQASEERLRLVAQATLDAYYDWNILTNSVWRNEGYQMLFGPTEPVGSDSDWWLARIHPDDRECVLSSIRSSYDSRKRTWRGEYRFQRYDGQYAFVLDRGYIEYDASGQPVRFLGAITDLTERKRVEERAKRHQDLLESIRHAQTQFLLEATPAKTFNVLLEDLLKLTNSEYGFIGEIHQSDNGQPYLKTHAITNIAWNQETRDFYEKNAPTGLEFFNLQTLFGAVMTTGQPVLANNPEQDPRRGGLPGGHPPLHAFLGLPFHFGSRLVGMVGIANRPGGYDTEMIEYLQPFLTTCENLVAAYQNAQDRRRAEADLRNSQERLRAMFETEPHCVKLVADDSTLLDMNNAGLAMMQASSLEVVKGKRIVEWVVPEYQEAYLAFLKKVCQGVQGTLEFAMIGPQGDRRQCQSHAVPFRMTPEGPVACLAITLDITESKRLEGERRNLEVQIQHSQKLESLGVLAGGIAHDFNNLLTTILGFAGLALMKLPSDSVVCPMLREVERAALRAADLTQQMLAYSGRGKFLIQALRLDSLVKEMSKLLETVVSKKAMLQLDLQPAEIQGDATQIKQVVTNLITNASDSLDGSAGMIRVRTGTRMAEAADLRTPFISKNLPPGEYAFVEIQDSGCGMTEETVAKIFDPFFTTKFIGRGLGLAAVLGIVRGHNGAIKVATRPGSGTVVEVLLPCTSEVKSEANSDVLENTSRPDPGTVLVVEDDPSVRCLVCNVLQDAGFRVREAPDGRQGLESFARYRKEIVAILLDLTMPHMDGVQTLTELRKLQCHVPVLVMSGYGGLEEATSLAGMGTLDFIQKPIRPQDLLARVSQLLPHGANG